MHAAPSGKSPIMAEPVQYSASPTRSPAPDHLEGIQQSPRWMETESLTESQWQGNTQCNQLQQCYDQRRSKLHGGVAGVVAAVGTVARIAESGLQYWLNVRIVIILPRASPGLYAQNSQAAHSTNTVGTSCSMMNNILGICCVIPPRRRTTSFHRGTLSRAQRSAPWCSSLGPAGGAAGLGTPIIYSTERYCSLWVP